MSYSDVIRELGYPAKTSLRNWYEEYIKTNDLHTKYIRKYKYSLEEKQLAVNYYLEHGKSVSRTVKKLGYPSRPELDKWISEIAPDQKRYCNSGGAVVKYTREQKEQAVISLCSRSKPAKEIAAEIGTTRENLYNWKRQLLEKDRVYTMTINNKTPSKSENTQSIESEVSELRTEKDNLAKQVVEMQKKLYRLKIEHDIYEKATEILKKDQGISIQINVNRLRKLFSN